MREFAIQKPYTRSWLYECYAVRLLRRHNILAPRCGFVSVYVNNNWWGVYLYQEGFTSQLLESMSRREGPIIKLKERGYYENEYVIRKLYSERYRGGYIKPAVNFMPSGSFKKGKFESNREGMKLYSTALQKFNLLRDKKLSAKEILDMPFYAKYYTIMSILAARHYNISLNFRHYYNPLNGLFQPVYYDAKFYKLNAGDDSLSMEDYRPHYLDKASHAAFLRIFGTDLKQLVSEKFIQGLKKYDQDYIQKQLKILRLEWPNYTFDWSLIDDNAFIFTFPLVG